MSGSRASISGVMKLTAIVAVSLALLRFVPTPALQIPIFVFLIVALQLAIVQACFGRPLRTFYFAFLIVGFLLTSVVTAFFCSPFKSMPDSLYNLEIAVQSRLGIVSRSRVIALYVEFPAVANVDGFVTCLLCMIPAWAAGVLASRWMRRRSGREDEWGTCIVGFLLGALAGLGLVFCVRLPLVFFLGPSIIDDVFWAGLVGGPLVGGLVSAVLTGRRLRKLRDANSPEAKVMIESVGITRGSGKGNGP